VKGERATEEEIIGVLKNPETGAAPKEVCRRQRSGEQTRYRLKRVREVIEASVFYRLAFAVLGRPEDLVKRTLGLWRFRRDLARYRQGGAGRFEAHFRDFWPKLDDWNDQAGIARGHYFHQDLWVAKRIFRHAPQEHWDVGSRVDGFIAHLLVFREVVFVDARELSGSATGLRSVIGSVTALKIPDASLLSLSCLHVLEHVGLGRYGDPIDPSGYEVGARELSRVLAPGGRLYFSVPIGRERLEFNAHRIFAPASVVGLFPKLDLEEFAAIDDSGALVERCPPEDFSDSDYACGIFVFKRPGRPPGHAAARSSPTEP
jgi:hypothetical protein